MPTGPPVRTSTLGCGPLLSSSTRMRASSGASSVRIRSKAGWPWSVFHTSRERCMSSCPSSRSDGCCDSAREEATWPLMASLICSGTIPPRVAPAETSALPIGVPDDAARAISPTTAIAAPASRASAAASSRLVAARPSRSQALADVLTPHPAVCRAAEPATRARPGIESRPAFSSSIRASRASDI